MLIVEDMHVSLAGLPVLRGVSLEALAGQVTAIVGPNGSGKTTLLRAMTGDLPARGMVLLEGENVAHLSGWALACRRAVLPQASRIAFPFTALEIVRLGVLPGVDVPPETRACEALARVGLAGFGGRLYQELSGGEQQRVQLARALAQVWEPVGPEGPRWLFLDEPVSSLDIGHQLQVMELVSAYARAGGGVVAVMHDLNLTAIYADRVILLSDGRCLASGPPEAVLTDALLSRAYGCAVRVGVAPPPPATYVLPHTARRAG